ncbi:hypothetical protein [Klebsiella aerogenes EA1509E]|nr:hypothetical protein [Klebsiella aerogenes EA1509E]
MLLDLNLAQLPLVHRTPGITNYPVHDRMAPGELFRATRLETFLLGVAMKLSHDILDADAQHHLAVFAPLDELPG